MIELKDIVVKFGDFEALHNINVEVREGEFFTFLGPSGCGKTTTLRTITGFIEPVSGTVNVKGVDITHVPIEKRNIGIVFQSYALFPSMTVYNNIAMGRTDATEDEVYEAAKKARCYDFIMALPEGFQTAEFQLEHGFVDKIVRRDELKDTIGKIIKIHCYEGGSF